jgi:putative acetyltransferase
MGAGGLESSRRKRGRSMDHPHPSPEFYRTTVLRRVDWSTDLELVRRLFQDYRDWLWGHADPASASSERTQRERAAFDRIIAELPGAYGPPHGDVVLAHLRENLVACGALRAWGPNLGEIKRIYIRPDHQGPGFGPILTGALLVRAREIGYERVRVDTLPKMAGAIQFYQEMGFKPIPSYWDHPVPGALFFEWNASESPLEPTTGAPVH